MKEINHDLLLFCLKNMDKFKKFLGKSILIDKLRESVFLRNFSLCCQRLPEEIEEFEEIELSINNIFLCIAVLKGKIKRIMLVKVDSSDPDKCSPLTKEELDVFLSENEDKLLKFFENITV